MTFVSFDSEVLVIITEVFMVAGPLVLLLLYAIAMLIGPRVFAPNPRRLHMHASVPDPSQESGSDEMTPPSASPGLENRQSDLTTDGTTQSRNGGDGSALSPSAPEMTEQQPTAWGIWAIRVLKDFILRAWMHLSFWAAMYVTIRVQHFWITRLSSFHPLVRLSLTQLSLHIGSNDFLHRLPIQTLILPYSAVSVWHTSPPFRSSNQATQIHGSRALRFSGEGQRPKQRCFSISTS